MQIGKTTVLLESPSKYVEQPRLLLVCPAFSHCSSFPLLLFWHMYTLTLLYTTTQGLLLLSHTHSHLRTHTHSLTLTLPMLPWGTIIWTNSSLPPFRCYCFHPSLQSEILLLLNSKWKPMVQVWIVECTAFTANGTPVLSKSQRLNVTFYQFGVAAIRHFPDLLRLKRKRRRMRKRDSEK